IYCPSTDFSRPIEQTELHSNDQMHIERMDDTESLDESSLELSNNSDDGEITENPVEVSNRLSLFTCVVCQREGTTLEMHQFAKHPTKRTRWVNAVRATAEGRRSLMEELSVTNCPRLCSSHFKPSDYKQNSSRKMLRINAVPFFQDPTECSGEEADQCNARQISIEI
ncbi:hypothetical protein PMAYCL1PPCAC_25692, partial [Pristionchus mayeri]